VSKGEQIGIPLERLQANLASDHAGLQQATVAYQKTAPLYDQAITAAATARNHQGNPLSHWIVYVGVAGAVVIGDALIILYVYNDKRRNFENRVIVENLAQSRSRLDTRSMNLADLWIANEEQLEGYHRLVLNYAASTRVTTQLSLLAGFLFLIVICAFALSSHSLVSAVASSVVATAGAVVTGFIARAVLRNAETSSSEVNAFFTHPLETQRILTAQRIADTMSDEAKQEAKLLMVKALVKTERVNRSQPKVQPGKS
jgi:hypothetical protein